MLRQCPPLPFHRPAEPNEFLVGRLMLPTGQLVACDPVTRAGGAHAFERTLSPGIYAVRLGAVAGEAAYVALMVGPERKVERWELARTVDGTDAFPVDASTAALLDVANLAQLTRKDRPDPFTRLLAAGYADRPHAVVDLGPTGNLVAFGTGTDGLFRSYWGLSSRGQPVVLVTDLGVLGPTPRMTAPTRAARSNVVPLRRR